MHGTIGWDEYADPTNGWRQYRSFTSRHLAEWYFDRLPDEDSRAYALVRHKAGYYIIAERETFAHRN